MKTAVTQKTIKKQPISRDSILGRPTHYSWDGPSLYGSLTDWPQVDYISK